MKSTLLSWMVVCSATCFVASAQSTPNIGLALPAINSANWGTKLNNNMTILDGLLSGNANVPGLHLSGNFQVPSQAGYTTIGGGLMGYDATTNVYVAGNNTTTIRFPYVVGSAPTGCVQWAANYSQTGTGVACGAGSGGGITGPGSSTNLFIPQWNGTSGNALINGLGLVTVIGTPGVDTNIPSEKAVRNAISAAGGGNVSTAGSLTIGNIITGGGGTTIQDSGKTMPTGPIADTNSAQTFTGKSIDATEINSGILAPARLPNPSAATLGGVESITPVTNQWVTGISTFGVPALAQPDFSNLSGVLLTAQTPLTTSQDILYRNGSSLGRLPIVAVGSCLGNSGGAWATVPCGAGTAPVNTKGDLFGFSTIAARIPVGSNGTVLTADSTQALGVKWASGSGSAASSIVHGLLSALPGTCAPGDVYFATDQPAGQQLYQCDSTNHFTQTLGLGASGALAVTGGLLDITSLVPLKAAANAFTGLSSFAVGQDMTEQASGTTPATGKLHIYANTDHTFHQVNSSGVDTSLGGGSSGPGKWVNAYNSTAQSIPGSYTETVMTFDTTDPATTDSGMHSGVTNNQRLVATATGIYAGSCTIGTSTASTGSVYMTVVLNDTTNINSYGEGAGPSTVQNGFFYNLPFSTPMTAGDYMTCTLVSDQAFTTTPGKSNTQFYMYQVH